MKEGEIVGEYSTYRGMANAFYKGTEMEKLDRNVEGTPHYTMYPESIQDVVEVIELARKKGKKIRVVGSGHSFTPLVQTEEILVSLDELKEL